MNELNPRKSFSGMHVLLATGKAMLQARFPPHVDSLVINTV